MALRADWTYWNTGGRTTANSQPMSILSLKRLFLSLGSLPRSKTIGICGLTIGLSKPLVGPYSGHFL